MAGATTPQSIGTLSGVAGSVIDLGANHLTLAGSGSGVFAGNIGRAGGLTLSGTGSQALTGNTFTGGTALTGGSLVVGSATALGLGALDVNGSASLGAERAGCDARQRGESRHRRHAGAERRDRPGAGGTIAGNGSLAQTGTGTTTLTGTNTFSGGTTLSAGRPSRATARRWVRVR